MITEREKRALQIAKNTFEHYTHDALEIAKQIIALEREMSEDQDKPVTIPVTLQPAPLAKNNDSIVVPATIVGTPKPVAEINSIRIAGPLNNPLMQQPEQSAKREFEEVPY